MPLPVPNPTEDESSWMDRCMGNSTMNDEYPDPKQRAAVCHSQWGEKSMSDIGIGFSLIGIGEKPESSAAPAKILLIRDGDPGWTGTKALMDAQGAKEVVESFARQGVDLVIDYEHATVDSEESFQKAPAAGWVKALEYVPGQGLFAAVEWTDTARQEIETRQYKYFSPTVFIDKKTRRVYKLHSVALTNRPATRYQRELLAASLGLLSHARKGKQMELKALKAALIAAGVKLAEDANDDLILAATVEFIGAVKAAPSLEAVAAKLGLDKGATCEVVVAKVSELLTNVPATEYKAVTARLESLENQTKDWVSHELVACAIDSAKLNPNDEKQMAWARNYAKADQAGFKSWSDSAPALYSSGRMVKASQSLDNDKEPTRDELVKASLKEFGDNREKFRNVEPWAYVNGDLIGKGMAKLTDDEKKALKV